MNLFKIIELTSCVRISDKQQHFSLRCKKKLPRNIKKVEKPDLVISLNNLQIFVMFQGRFQPIK